MARTNLFEKAIAALESDKAVLDMAIAKLKAQIIKSPRTTKKTAPIKGDG